MVSSEAPSPCMLGTPIYMLGAPMHRSSHLPPRTSPTPVQHIHVHARVPRSPRWCFSLTLTVFAAGSRHGQHVVEGSQRLLNLRMWRQTALADAAIYGVRQRRHCFGPVRASLSFITPHNQLLNPCGTLGLSHLPRFKNPG